MGGTAVTSTPPRRSAAPGGDPRLVLLDGWESGGGAIAPAGRLHLVRFASLDPHACFHARLSHKGARHTGGVRPRLARFRVMAIEKTVLIARPLEEIWGYVADLRNDAQWCDKVLSVEQVAGDGPGRDAEYVVVHRPVRLKQPKQLAVTVVEFDPPRRMRLREEDADAVFDVTYELHPAADGTQLAQRDRIDWKIPKFQRPIARRMVSRDIQHQFSALRRLLEAR
jgi:Polyketide cyclase / dehydrase and lipid transport